MNSKFTILLLSLLSVSFYNNSWAQYNVNSNYWAVSDALGREAVNWYQADNLKPEKYVGIFYHTWHINNNVDYTHPVMNLTNILQANDESVIEQDWDHVAWGGLQEGENYYWDESLFGYYRTTDDWVLRKHAEMLADAGVDVVFFDVTNGSVTWKDGYTRLLEVWHQARLDGVNTPKIAFVLTLWSNIIEGALAGINQLYEDLYKNPGDYEDLLFYWKGKPLIMAYPEILENVPEAESAAMKFHANNAFISFYPSCPSYSDNIGNLTLSLYKWNTDYNTTISQQPIASKEFVDFDDNAGLPLTFSSQPAGDYLWVLDNAVQEVGVWKYVEETTGVTSYFNGVAVSGDYHTQINYGTSYENLTSGSNNTPQKIGAGYDPVQIADMKNHFTFRPGQGDYVNGPDYGRNDQWSWLEVSPQHGFVDNGDGTYEQMSVGIAQNASTHSNGHCTAFNGPDTWGRNYSKAGGWDNSEFAEYKGINFQEQWDRALEVSPELVFVTGWNEWTVSRWRDWSGCTSFAPVEVAFQDAVDGNRSRDIEPVKSWGEYGDSYYIQLVDNVRKFKGMSRPDEVSAEKTINIGLFDSWVDVSPEFNHYKGNTIHRSHQGAGNLYYTNTTGRNDFVLAKVARDADNIYFYIETNNNISASTDPGWMRLLIDIDRNKDTGWEGYDYVLNRVNPGTKALLEKSTSVWEWTEVDSVEFAVNGTMMEIKIPKVLMGIASDSDLDFEFKWSDNMQDEGNIMDFYLNGDVAPGGRFNFIYTTKSLVGIKNTRHTKSITLKSFPNPFTEHTTIEFSLPEEMAADISVFNLMGMKIKNIHSGRCQAGLNRFSWDGRNSDGSRVRQGLYFIRVVGNSGVVGTISSTVK
jgi:hypothetical protein